MGPLYRPQIRKLSWGRSRLRSRRSRFRPRKLGSGSNRMVEQAHSPAGTHRLERSATAHSSEALTNVPRFLINQVPRAGTGRDVRGLWTICRRKGIRTLDSRSAQRLARNGHEQMTLKSADVLARKRSSYRVLPERQGSWYRYGDSNPGPVAEKRSRRPRWSPVALVFVGNSRRPSGRLGRQQPVSCAKCQVF
jgi:hypothetical protein